MKTDSTLLISELFYSIQGESSHAGSPCLFIRLAGCNLRCTYCDARYTYEESGREMTIAEIVNFVRQSPVALVEITGGEPLLQENVYPLMATLITEGRRVLLETNGSVDLAGVPDGVVKIMDIKCPGSGMAGRTHPANLQRLGRQDELKFVLGSRADYLWAVDFLKKNLSVDPQQQHGPQIHFSPVTSTLAPAELAAWILADHLPVRLQLQLHTLLWPQLNRGV